MATIESGRTPPAAPVDTPLSGMTVAAAVTAPAVSPRGISVRIHHV